MTEQISTAIDAKISGSGTELIAMRVNIAIGEVNGTNEHIRMAVLSTAPDDMENITTIKPTTNSMEIGITAVLMSSILETVDPMAPYRKAYINMTHTPLPTTWP